MRVSKTSTRASAGVLAVSALLLVLATPADSRRLATSFCNTEALGRIEARSTGPRTQEVGLAMKSGVVQPGEIASARLFNRGGSRAGYGVALRIERLVAGQWSLDPASPKGPWPKKLGRLDPGGLSTCFRFPVPRSQSAGRYRFTVSVQLEQRATHRSALFQIRSR
jgi:hypothetical protein